MSNDFNRKEWISPDNSFTKFIISRGYGFTTPQDGSLCRVQVLSDESEVVKNVDCDLMKELVVGDVDEPIEKIIEACIRTMKEEEICSLKFHHPSVHSQVNNKFSSEQEVKDAEGNIVEEDRNALDEQGKNCTLDSTQTEDSGDIKESLSSSVESPVEKDPEEVKLKTDVSPDDFTGQLIESLHLESPTMYEVQLLLLSYSREPEIWEMSITEKWRRATYHKQKGMELYARGEYQWAFHRFGLTLKYIVSLEHDVPSGHEEGMNMMGLKLSCYLNVAACQMRHHNYESVVKNCCKALELQPDNAKALYRRGSAYIQLQEYEKAKQDLNKAQEFEPKNPAIMKQQQLLKARLQKLNQYYASAMKKMFS